MSVTLERATRFQDLCALESHGEPYVFRTIFDEKGWRARRLSKKKFKLLRRVDPKLRQVLEAGERVRYLTSGSGVSFWEFYFLGWAMYYLNRRAGAGYLRGHGRSG